MSLPNRYANGRLPSASSVSSELQWYSGSSEYRSSCMRLAGWEQKQGRRSPCGGFGGRRKLRSCCALRRLYIQVATRTGALRLDWNWTKEIPRKLLNTCTRLPTCLDYSITHGRCIAHVANPTSALSSSLFYKIFFMNSALKKVM